MNGKRMVRAAAVLLAGMSAVCCAHQPEQPEIREEPVPETETAGFVLEGNLLKIGTVQEFINGDCSGLNIDPSVGDGALRLEEGVTEGYFESAVYECTSFEQMTACWNAAVYEGGEIEVYARARTADGWTEYLTWGPYTPYDVRGTKDGKTDALAFVHHDLFCLRDGRTADAVQMKAVLRRRNADDASPVLRMMTMTFRGGGMVPGYAEEPLDVLPERSVTDAPAVSQLVRAPGIARAICSPTVMSVMLNSRMPELSILPEELALNTRDEGEGIFGNWSFDAAGAGLYGFEAYTQFSDLNILLQELAKGHPVGINVSYTNEEDAELPFLDGVYGTTNGHIICLTGYEYEDGIRDEEHLYFYCSDSFSARDADSFRRYAWRQLKDCFRGMAYIIPDTVPEVTGVYAPGIPRIAGELVPDGGRPDTWILCTGGEPVDMSRFVNGNGILAYCVDAVYAGPVFTDANRVFGYGITLNDDGTLVLERETLLERTGQPDTGQEIIICAVSDRGVSYRAVLPAE